MRRIDDLARRLDLITTQAPASRVLKTQARESLAVVHLLWNNLEVLIGPLRERGWGEQADRYLAELRDCTRKRLPEMHPNLPVADVIAHWDQVSDVLAGMAALYRTTS